MITFKLWLSAVFVTLLLIGCASSSQVVSDVVSIPVTVSTSVVTGEAAAYVDEFYKALQDRGFKYGETDDPNAAEMIVSFDPNVFHTEFVIQLAQRGRMIVESRASNSGWGTGIARPQALARLADEVTKNFRRELSKLSLKIVPDQQLLAQLCAGSYTAVGLDPIRGKVVFDEIAQPTFAQLTNQSLASDDEVKAIGLWADLQKSCLDSTTSALQGRSNSGDRIDMELARFNENQALLAALATRRIAFGELAAKRLELNAKYARLRMDRAAAMQDRAEKEKDRGIATTNQTQQTFNSQMQSAPRNTFTTCNRIGTQIFCRSY